MDYFLMVYLKWYMLFMLYTYTYYDFKIKKKRYIVCILAYIRLISILYSNTLTKIIRNIVVFKGLSKYLWINAFFSECSSIFETLI